MNEKQSLAELESVLTTISPGSQCTIVLNNGTMSYKGENSYMSGDKYINENGQVGAMGPNAKAENNTFIQNNNSNLDNINLTSEDANKLKALVDKINQGSSDEIQKSEAFMASGHIHSLIESIEEGNTDKQEENIIAWKQWFGNLRENARTFISTSADLVNISVGLMTILEMSKVL